MRATRISRKKIGRKLNTQATRAASRAETRAAAIASSSSRILRLKKLPQHAGVVVLLKEERLVLIRDGKLPCVCSRLIFYPDKRHRDIILV